MIGYDITTGTAQQVELIETKHVAIEIAKWNALSIEAEQLANGIIIQTDEDNVFAIDCLTKIKQFGKEVEAERVSTVSPFNKLVDRINGIFKPISASISGAEGIIKKKMLVFAEAKEKERKLEEDRIRKDNQERERLAHEEHQRKLEAARTEEARTAKAVEAPVYQAPVQAPLPKAHSTSSGYIGKTTVTSSWKGEVSDAMEIVKAIAAGTVPISVIEFRTAELNKYAKAIGIEGVWTGIKVTEVKGIKAGSN